MADRKKYIILEDSHFMALDLHQSIQSLRPDMELAAFVDETTEAIKLLETSEIDLIISDSTAGDGNVIDTFRKAEMNVPLILISEFEEMKKLGEDFNLVDFILKPVTKSRLEGALRKFEISTENAAKQTATSQKQ